MANRIVAVPFVVITLFASPCVAQDPGDRNAKVLEGIEGFSAAAVVMGEGFGLESVEQDLLQHDLELRLREARVPLVSWDEAKTLPGSPGLMLSVYLSPRSGLLLYLIRLEFHEQVHIPRNPDIWFVAPTVNYTHHGLASDFDEVRQQAREVLGFFIKDFLAGNAQR